MMRFGRGWQEVAERRKARREREDSSRRLHDVVPKLERFHLEVSVEREGVVLMGTAHVRRFVVANAPALFVLPCTDEDCKDGGHDVTDGVVRSLQNSLERFDIVNRCNGQIGSTSCKRVMHLAGAAGYRA